MSDGKPYLGFGDFCVDGGQHSSQVIGASATKQKYVMKILPSSLAFAVTEVGDETAPSFLSVINLGTKPITIYEITVVGDFNIMTSFVMGSTLLPNGSFDIAVKFAPKHTGAVTGGVYIRATESVGIEFAELVGTGNIADPSIPDTISASTYTLLSTDHGKDKRCTASGGCVVTVPSALPTGFACSFLQAGAGPINFVAGSGAVVSSRGGSTATAGQWAVAAIKVYSSGVVVVMGDLG
jgi:hypothetical protein